MYLCTDDPVVQWIEFKIPVLTMKVRILSESLPKVGVWHLAKRLSSIYEGYIHRFAAQIYNIYL